MTEVRFDKTYAYSADMEAARREAPADIDYAVSVREAWGRLQAATAGQLNDADACVMERGAEAPSGSQKEQTTFLDHANNSRLRKEVCALPVTSRDAAWHNTEPGRKGPLRDILDMSEYTGMVFGTVGLVSKGVCRTVRGVACMAVDRVVAAVREPGKPGSVAPFEEAKDFVWKLGLKEKEEWWEWERSGQRPGDIPSHPDRMYSEEGWDGWDDWLGVGKGGAHVEEFRPFNEARSFVHTLGLRNLRDWNLWSGSGQRPPAVSSEICPRLPRQGIDEINAANPLPESIWMISDHLSPWQLPPPV
eukprot:jgi/Tetstr1/443909/TSEL_031861.t1